jgi:hypothetical protein
VIESNVLVPRLVPVASRPRAPVVVIVVDPKSTVPALLRRMPVAPLVLTVRSDTLVVPVVPVSSRPGWAPAVPASSMVTSEIVAPLEPAAPLMAPPVPDGSRLRPATTAPDASVTTSLLVAVSAGRVPAACSVTAPIDSPACSPISRSLASRTYPPPSGAPVPLRT